MPTSPKILNNVLAIDSSGTELALGINGQVRRWTQDQHYSELLLAEIAKLLKRAKVKPDNLAGVNFISGPGSFTGLRIGATIANGIGFVEKIGVRGVTHFEIVRKVFPKVDLIVLDAGRGEVFVERKQKAPRLVTVPELTKLIRVGERVYVDTPDLVAKTHPQLKAAGTIYIGPVGVEQRLNLLMSIPPLKKYRQVLPLYLREANITRSKKSKSQPKT